MKEESRLIESPSFAATASPLTLRAKTPQEAKRLLQDMGITLKQFAVMHGFDYRTVSEVVRGVNKGLYGEGHRVAVAFGLKSS